MTIDRDTVWYTIWPQVEAFMEATLAENPEQMRRYLLENSIAADMLDLFDYPIFDILLKTVLGREKLGVTRAVETENGRYVHLEYAWPDPDSTDNSYTANDVVTVTLTATAEEQWRIVEINPSAIDLPLNGGRARAVIATGQTLNEDRIPGEAWILPYTLYGGLLKMRLRPEALADAVEQLLLPALQDRSYGVMAQLYGRRLWRDFRQTANPALDKPAGWAAAVEYILSEQDMRNATQASVAKQYKLPLSLMAPRIRQIKAALDVQKPDERYSDMQTVQIVTNQNP